MASSGSSDRATFRPDREVSRTHPGTDSRVRTVHRHHHGQVSPPPEEPRASNTPPRPGPIRVVLADDHLVVRKGLRALLESLDGFEVVGEAG